MYVEDFWELGRVAAGLNPVPSVIRHRYHFKPGSKGCAFYIFTGEFRTVAHGTLAQLLATFWGQWTRRWGIAQQRSASTVIAWLHSVLQKLEKPKLWTTAASSCQQMAETLPPSCKKSTGRIPQREWKNTTQRPWRTVLAKHQRSINAIWNTFYLSWVDRCHYHLASNSVHEQHEPSQQDS